MIAIRKFKPSDLESVLHVFHEAIHTTGAKYYDEDQIKTWGSVDDLDKKSWLQSLTDNITYVAVVDDTIVGFGDMNHSGYIDRVFILQKYQGQGILQTMVKKFEDEALKLNLAEITTEASIVAMPIAKRMGYEIVTKQFKEYKGKRFVNYLMRKQISDYCF